MTTSSTGSPKKCSASSFKLLSTNAESSSARNCCLPSRKILSLPIKRLNAEAVICGAVANLSRAASPTKIEPSSVTLTTEGVNSCPSLLGIRRVSPSINWAIKLFVVPKSIPICTLIIYFHSVYMNLQIMPQN